MVMIINISSIPDYTATIDLYLKARNVHYFIRYKVDVYRFFLISLCLSMIISIGVSALSKCPIMLKCVNGINVRKYLYN
jgi:hypothetical protein